MDHIPEDWKPIPEFPAYAVSTHGRVMTIATELIKVPQVNNMGIVNILLSKSGELPQRRSVAPLVAQAFLDPPTRADYDTPMHLDGDLENVHVLNLAWRPRWFVVRYHAQFKRPVAYDFRGSIELVETGERFDDLRECAMKYGMLEKDIIHACNNQSPVFPHWYHFQLVY